MAAKSAIDSFLNPASIAVVGAAERPTSSGGVYAVHCACSTTPGAALALLVVLSRRQRQATRS